jgi:hypothetical protein
VSLRPENNSFLNVRNRFYLNKGKSLRKSEEICEIEFWPKIRKKGQAYSKSTGPKTLKSSPCLAAQAAPK